MAVTAAMVKELREITGAGMSDCKKALDATDGNIEKSIEFLREKGLAAAAKKAGRIASEGIVHAYVTDDGKTGVLVEVNSETDFVAKNKDFQSFVQEVAKQAAASASADIGAFLSEAWQFGEGTVKDALSQRVAVIGENLSIRRFEKYPLQKDGALITYIHGGGRVAVMLELHCDKPGAELTEAGKNVCMQIAAMSPRFVKREDISEDFIQKEKEILTQQALNEGKAANIVEKMIVGRLNKELKEFCLLEQEYVKDGDMNVGGYLESVGKAIGAPVTAARFVRFETGEGLAKKEENFAEEVSKAMQV